MNPSDLKTSEVFRSLFRRDKSVVNAIINHMHENKFDPAFPIVLGTGPWTENGPVVIDGHTRLEVAKFIGLDEVPVIEREFETEDDALRYAVHNQRDRRNLTEAELLSFAEVLKRRRKTDRDPETGKFTTGSNEPTVASAQSIADDLGISRTKAVRTLAVSDHADEETKEAVKAGKKSINEAYEETQEKRKQAGGEKPHKFNAYSERIDWAKWSWNPVTGCKHGCEYCYGQAWANRFNKGDFSPQYYPERLQAPEKTPIPAKRMNEPGIRNVFVCSMADLFGEWVPQEWIDAVLKACADAPQWNFIFLTKNPKRLPDIDFPPNAWVGATVDTQACVNPTIEALEKVKAKVKFVSCEPMLERLDFPSMPFEWLIIGPQSDGSRIVKQPEWEWVKDLEAAARRNGISVYCKPGLDAWPRDYPAEQDETQEDQKPLGDPGCEGGTCERR